MQHPPKARFVARDRVWLAALGEYDEKRRRRRDVPLADEHGNRLTEPEHAESARQAVDRIWGEQERRRRALLGPTVTDLTTAYLEHQIRAGRKPLTIRHLREHLEAFCLFDHGGVLYGQRPAASIELADLTRVRKAMAGRGCKTGYIRHRYAAVLACWRWAARPVEDRTPERLLPANPFEGIERPKPGKGRKLVLPWAAIEQLVTFAEERAERVRGGARGKARLRALQLRLIAESGCRPKETCDLEWAWVFEDEGMIEIPWEHHKTGWRDERERYIGFSRATAEKLRAHRTGGKAHPRWVFSPRDRKQDFPPHRREFMIWFRGFRAEAIAAKVPIPAETTLYTLRRSFITSARKGGIDFSAMPLATGNSADVARKIYDQSNRESARLAWAAMDDARRREATSGPGTDS